MAAAAGMAAAVLGRRGNPQGRDAPRESKVDGAFEQIGFHGISLD
jgi:hypothetical protein